MAEMIDIAGFRINWGEWNQLNQQLKADLLFMLQFCGGKMTNSNMKSSVVARPMHKYLCPLLRRALTTGTGVHLSPNKELWLDK